MASASLDRAHAMLAQARLTAASAAVASGVPELRRFAGGVFALAGAEKGLAAAIDPHLLGANGRTNGYLDALPGGAQWFDHAAAAGSLDWEHKDPFDRILVAQAGTESMTLLSADAVMKSAPGVRVL